MKMKQFFFALGCLFLVALTGRAQLNVSATAAKLEAFAPNGWQIEKQIAGDLNKDNSEDAVLVLVQKLPANADKDNPPERQRALVALFKSANGQWQRAGVAEKLLLCTSCGGAFYGVVEAPVEVEISKGVIVVSQEYSSRNVTGQTFRFRYDAATSKFGLIGLDISDRDRATGSFTDESSNFLTGVKTYKKTQMSEKGGEKLLRNTRQAIPKTQKPMEAVNYEDYYAK